MADETNKPTMPTVHLNGTSADALLDHYCDARSAVRAAQEALADAAPNARDYYVQSPDAYARARDEHLNRIMRLQKIYEELTQIAEHVAEQRDARTRR